MAVNPTLITCKLMPTSALPRDVVENTFALQADDAASAEAIATAFGAFYDAISEFLAPSVIDEDGLQVWAATINLAAGTLEPAILIGTSDTGTHPFDSLPQEVACCLTLSAEGATSVPARDRGRVYIGPLGVNALQESGGEEVGRPSTTFVSTLANAASQLGNDLADATALWCIWSRTDHVLKTIGGGWVDNEFDTVRSRGREANARTVWGI